MLRERRVGGRCTGGMRFALLVAVCVALVGAGSAAAKEVTRALVCGEGECRTVTDRGQLRTLPCCSETTAPAPETAPFYWIDATVRTPRGRHSFGLYYVPSARLLAANGPAGSVTWHRVYGAGIGALDTLVGGIEPFEAPDRWPRMLEAPDDLSSEGATSGRRVTAATGAGAVVLLAAALAALRVRRRPSRH
jgi:hypothetical protein